MVNNGRNGCCGNGDLVVLVTYSYSTINSSSDYDGVYNGGGSDADGSYSSSVMVVGIIVADYFTYHPASHSNQHMKHLYYDK